jgi:Phosphotransferase enzyme family
MADQGVTDVPRAVEAAKSTAAALGLAADEAIVLQASNRLTIRLLPSDVLARVAHRSHGAAQLEVDLATRLAGTGSSIAALDPRVAPRVYEQEEFHITVWTYYPARPSSELAPADYAAALSRLHAGLRRIDATAPHCLDRVEEAAGLIGIGAQGPGLLNDADRTVLVDTLTRAARAIRERGAADQLLHGEPHPGNVLNTQSGPLFVDLETCCRGPVEFDVAHAPEEVADFYPNLDEVLLRECRVLVLAMALAWRLDPADQLPNGKLAAKELIRALRAGPPYPAPSTITGLS